MNWYTSIKVAAISDSAMNQIEMMSGNIMDHYVIEDWEMYLIETESPIPQMDRIYQIALQRNDTDFAEQHQKHNVKLPVNPFDVINGIKDKISSWLGQHGQLIVSSMNKSKQDKYKKILSSMGFNLQEMKMGPYNLLLVVS